MGGGDWLRVAQLCLDWVLIRAMVKLLVVAVNWPMAYEGREGRLK
jgi:hypothetical protein